MSDNGVKRWRTVETDSKGKAKMDDVTICIPFIRNDCVLDCLRSIHKHVKSVTYKIVCVNQTKPNREFEEALYNLSDVVIRPHYNWGFAEASNVAIRIAPTPWICVCNDDVEFLNDPFPGIFETFERFETAAAVCSQSPKEPGWGWGEPGYRYLIPEKYMAGELKELHNRDRVLMSKVKETKVAWEKYQQQSARDPDTGRNLLAKLEGRKQRFQETQNILDDLVFEIAHEPAFIEELIKEKDWQVVDGFAMYMPVFRTDRLEEIGLFDEKFRDGGGEDYEWLWRSSKKGYRNLSTSRSYVWHWWSRTKESSSGYNVALPSISKPWNKLSVKGFGSDGLVDPDACVWGTYGERTDPVIYRHLL